MPKDVYNGNLIKIKCLKNKIRSKFKVIKFYKFNGFHPNGRKSKNLRMVRLKCNECDKNVNRTLNYMRELLTNSPHTKGIYCSNKCRIHSTQSLTTCPTISYPTPFIAKHISQTAMLEIGKAAEYLVCCHLTLMGYRVILADPGSVYDIIVDLNGKLLKLQVKATCRKKVVAKNKHFTPVYKWNINKRGRNGKICYNKTDFDLIALVALDIGCIAYIPFIDTSSNVIQLREPGTVVNHRNYRSFCIDQYPFDKALDRLPGKNNEKNNSK